MAQVYAWLDAGGSIDAQDSDGYTLVACCAFGAVHAAQIEDEQVALARHLVSRGANVNIVVNRSSNSNFPYHGWSPLQLACIRIRTVCAAPSMISLLLAAGANVNARNNDGDTPLAICLNDRNASSGMDHWLEAVTLLLKGGASLDECRSGRSAEDILVNGYHLEPQQLVVNRRGDNFLAVKALIYGVRKHGSYKRYMRAPHRDVLACRGLAQRGKLSTEHRALNFLAKQGDNGIVWTVLSYWRATE